MRCMTTVSAVPRKKVVLGMSGGVDSSVAALILSRNPAYEVIGVYMKNWDPQEETVATKCTEEEDNRYLDAIGKQIGLQIHRVDFVKQVLVSVSRGGGGRDELTLTVLAQRVRAVAARLYNWIHTQSRHRLQSRD